MLDNRDRSVLAWVMLKQFSAEVELGGPLKEIELNGVVHKSRTIQIPITNLGSIPASVNAIVTG